MAICIQTEHESDLETVLVQEDVKSIVLFNDDVNTFDFVIETLVEVCQHEILQAEQCTILVHYAGKCQVKKGTYSELVPICTALLDRGLTAEIQ